MGLPWAWINGSDYPTNSDFLTDELPNRGLTGYCIDLLERLADDKHMDFDYEIIPASKVQNFDNVNLILCCYGNLFQT